MGQGLLYEVMNMAALWKLPVIYVCENNLYNEYTHNSETLAGDMLTRAAGFGIAGQSIDGQDVRKVYATAKEIVERVRRGAGPAFLVCNTYRFMGHHVGDVSREYYRSKQEETLWKTERDPLKLLAGWLTEGGLVERARLERVQAEVGAEVEKAVEFAVAAPYPSVDKVGQDVYA
jgi:pyruvate dehydrogenase E1 component alpha subunit